MKENINEHERLVDLLKEAKSITKNITLYSTIDEIIDTSYDDLVADYLLKNGVIVLPCKIGDNVYEITKDCFNCSYLKDYSDTYICERNPDRNLFDVDYEKDCKYKISKIVFTYSLVPYIGRHVFLTKEEAERALKEIINKDA